MELLGLRRSTFGSDTSSGSASLKKRTFGSKKGLCPDHPLAYCTVVNDDLATYICYKCRVSPVRSSSPHSSLVLSTTPAKRSTPPKDSGHLVTRTLSDTKILFKSQNISAKGIPRVLEGAPEAINTDNGDPVLAPSHATEGAAGELSGSTEPESSYSSADRGEAVVVDRLPPDAPRIPSLRLMRLTATLDERFENIVDTKLEISKKIASDNVLADTANELLNQVQSDNSPVDGFYIVDRNFTYDDYLRLVVKKKSEQLCA